MLFKNYNLSEEMTEKKMCITVLAMYDGKKTSLRYVADGLRGLHLHTFV